MSIGTFSDYIVNQWLSDFSICWVALHYDNPEIAGAYASEVFGGAYARLKGACTAPSNKATFNATALNFTGLPAVKITHLAAWDATVNGNYLAMAPLPEPVRVINGGRYLVPANQLAFSFA